MKSKQPFSEKSTLRIANKNAEVAERLHSYIEYVDTSDLVTSYYNNQWVNQEDLRVRRGD